MSLTTDITELIKLCDDLRSKGNGGLFDEWFLETFKLQKIRKWGPFAKFMKYTYFHSFGRKRILTGIRIDFYELKEALFILHTRIGRNNDCMGALELAANYFNSLPKPKEKKWDRKTYLFFVLIPSFLGLVEMIHSLQLDWIIPFLIIGAISLLIPLLGGFGASSLFSTTMEIWWEKHWRRKLGIDALKAKIIDQTMERPLSY